MSINHIAKSWVLAVGLSMAASQMAAADPVVLKFAPFASPGQAAYEQFYKPWSEKVTASSNGALTIDLRGGTSIVNNQNVYDRVMNDVVQIGFVLFNYIAGKFPLAESARCPIWPTIPSTVPTRCGGSIKAARSMANSIRRSH